MKFRKGDLLDLLPSVGWFFLMMLPFWLQFHTFVSMGKMAHLTALLLVGVTLLFSDFFSYRLQKKITSPVQDNRFVARLAIIVPVIMLFFWVMHLLSMPEIPYFQELLGETDHLKLAVARENASKLLDVPLWFIYICQIASTLAPIFLILLFMQKRWILGIIFTLCIYIYTHATLAKGPYLIFLFLMLILSYRMLSNKYKKIVMSLSIIASLLGISWTIFICATNTELSPFLYKHPKQEELVKLFNFEKEQDLSFTYADNFRLLSNRQYYFDLDRYIQSPIYLVYRMILVPVEVSHRWYTYYPEKHQGYIGFYGLTSQTRNADNFQHPSNTIGRWAYQQRFPKQYLDSVNAYASADADAHARWGLTGIFILCLALLFIRFYLSWLNNGSPLLQLSYYTALVILAVNLPAGSIQAILIAQGLFTILLIMSVCRLLLNVKFQEKLNRFAIKG